MQQDQFGGEIIDKVYERERLRRRARQLGLRLIKFRKEPTQSRMRSRVSPGPALAPLVRPKERAS